MGTKGFSFLSSFWKMVQQASHINGLYSMFLRNPIFSKKVEPKLTENDYQQKPHPCWQGSLIQIYHKVECEPGFVSPDFIPTACKNVFHPNATEEVT